MNKIVRFEHRFVQSAPRELDNGVLYVSMDFGTALHQCACGCGNRVVTPFSPTDWKMTYDGQAVSLHPSIGNWSLKCRSHYFIRSGQTVWADDWSDQQIKLNRQHDRSLKGLSERPAVIIDQIAKPKTTESMWVFRVWKWVVSCF